MTLPVRQRQTVKGCRSGFVFFIELSVFVGDCPGLDKELLALTRFVGASTDKKNVSGGAG